MGKHRWRPERCDLVGRWFCCHDTLLPDASHRARAAAGKGPPARVADVAGSHRKGKPHRDARTLGEGARGSDDAGIAEKGRAAAGADMSQSLSILESPPGFREPLLAERQALSKQQIALCEIG